MADSRLTDLKKATIGRVRGGRKVNEVMFDIASIEVKNYAAHHKGCYPSATYLSKKVSESAMSLFEAIKSGQLEDSSSEYVNFLRCVFEKRDQKLAKTGTDFLPIKTAEAYLKRIKET